MRKLYLTIKAITMVPIISSITAIVNVEEGVNLNMVCKRILRGKVPANVILEDSELKSWDVGSLVPEEEVEMSHERADQPLQEQVYDYLTRDDVVTRLIDFEVTYSK